MMKRLFILFAASFFFMSQLSVYADVVMGNDFYYQNMDKTEEIGERQYGKRFIINNPLGYVIPKEEPGSEKGIPSGMGYGNGWGYEDIDEPGDIVFVFKNSEICTIEATYLHNGRYWGVMSPSHRYQPSGWVLMDDLLVIYDRPYFEAENKDKFYEYTGSYDAVLSAKKLVEWQWPGSDREKRIVEDNISQYANVLFAYKDNEGREWGKTSYSEGWICLSDPANSDIPAFNPALQPAKWSPDGSIDWSADVTIWPSADYKELRSANKPQSAFENIEENKFFLQHGKEAKKLERTRFYANGPDGYVVLRAEPGVDGEILTHWAFGSVTYTNGEQISVDYVYNHNGEYWGFMDYAYDKPHPPGWLPMDYLLMMYTNNDFINEHIEKLYTYTGDGYTALTTETFVLWEWPGSDRVGEVWGIKVLLNERTSAYYGYMDDEGREWVYIETYWNDLVSGWLCVNDPENMEIPAFNPEPKPIKWSPDDNSVNYVPKTDVNDYFHFDEYSDYDNYQKSFNMPVLIIIVSALVVIIAMLIGVFRRIRKNRK